MTHENEGAEANAEPIAPPVKKPKPSVSLWVTLWGWYGVFAIFGAYYLSSLDYIDQGKRYQFLNLSGAIGLSVLCFKKRTWQPFVLNAAWAAIAGYAIYKLLFGEAA